MGLELRIAWLVVAAAAAAAAAASRPAAPGPVAEEPPAPKVLHGAPLAPYMQREQFPSQDKPRFVPAGEARFMKEAEPVIGITAGRAAKAYPVWVLEHREVVNDTAGEIPVAVTWCSIAGTGIVYRRSVGDRLLTLASDGSLWKEAQVLFDRETESRWTQITGEALEGPLDGNRLQAIPSVLTTWGRWKQSHADSLILVKGPGWTRSLWDQQYENDPDRLGIAGKTNPDRRLGGKSRVLGIEPGTLGRNAAIAYVEERPGIVNDVIEGVPVVVVRELLDPAARLFRRTASGRELHFVRAPSSGAVVDRETGSIWDLLSGEAVKGRLAGARLDPVSAVSAYWFVWTTFHPGSELRPPSSARQPQ